MIRAAKLAAGFALACLACGEPESGVPTRDCAAVIWARATQAGPGLEVVGSWDGWAQPGAPMVAQDDGWQALRLDLPPGDYSYLVVDGGIARLDPYNPLTAFRPSDGREVSWLRVPDCAAPLLDVESITFEGGIATIAAAFLAADLEPRAGLDPDSVTGPVTVAEASAVDGTIVARTEPLSRGRQELELGAADSDGRPASRRISVFVDPLAPRWQDAIIYQVMIDRFYGDGGVALAEPATPASRAGGTLGGVEAALERGDFEALGVSALWLSPVYRNPVEAREGVDGRLYEGYHGYWVERDREVEARIGGAEALHSLVEAAHARGIAVILDVIPNHVYETNPIVAAHRQDGWFNEHPQECVCGTPTCPWADFMQDCWFAPYLPDIRVEHPDAINYAVGEILWWLDEFQVDGLRVDAVPMMPRAATRRIVHEVRAHTAPGDDRLILGEVFVGAGTGGVAGLAPYIGPDGLDSVFDFPTMWALREVLGPNQASFTTLDALLDHIDGSFAGSGVVLGRMLGNHDVVRFASSIVGVGGGMGGGDPWLDPPAQIEGDSPEELAALERVALGLSLQLTLPGMPVLYYGDELGLAGAGDPDNRRVMPELATLSPARLALLEHARALGQLRRCSPALRSSVRETLHVGDDTYAFARTVAPDEGGSGGSGGSGAGAVVVLVSRADSPRTISLPGSTPLRGRVRDVVSGVTLDLDASPSLELGPRAALILLSEDDPCAT